VSPSYRDVVDNAMTGHEWLRRNMADACPRARCVRFGWQIDMFSGYSPLPSCRTVIVSEITLL
jgi:hypothetical protein